MALKMESIPDDLTVTVEKTLRQLRIPGHLIGLQYLIAAVSKAIKDPSYPLFVTKRMYPEIGLQLGSSGKAVERAMRNAVRFGWDLGNKSQLEQMAGYPLLKRPNNALFVDIVATYIRYNLHT